MSLLRGFGLARTLSIRGYYFYFSVPRQYLGFKRKKWLSVSAGFVRSVAGAFGCVFAFIITIFVLEWLVHIFVRV